MHPTTHLHSEITNSSSLGKPTIFAKAKPLSGLSVLIIDPDYTLAKVVRNILFALGCQSVTVLRDGMYAKPILEEGSVDIVITEYALKSMSGLDLVTHLRRSADSASRNLPVVMVSAQSERQHIELARSQGIDEYVLKPFTAKALLERIYALIEKPRSFIISSNYVGPDRRRLPQNDNIAAENGRPYTVRKAPKIIAKDEMQTHLATGEPCMLLPDYALQKKTGFVTQPTPPTTQMSTPVLTTPDAPITLLRHHAQSIKDTFAALQQKPTNHDILSAELIRMSYALAKSARGFGYDRAAQVAILLNDFCTHYMNIHQPRDLKIAASYVDALSTLITNDVKGTGGNIGEMLYKNLTELMQNYKNA